MPMRERQKVEEMSRAAAVVALFSPHLVYRSLFGVKVALIWQLH
jgi:hypothetical protein